MLARNPRTHYAFTLIELLVVISIIALLIEILLPALGSARSEAKAIACGANLRQVAIAMTTYTTEYDGYFPPSYVYPTTAWNGSGNGSFTWDINQQLGTGSSNGYAHWSYFLMNNSVLEENAFACPQMEYGGHPATNPYADAEVDGQGDGGGSGIDRQARWMAYAGNEAIIPRNKFASTNPRPNRLVRGAEVKEASDTIVATEYIDSYPAISTGGTAPGISKSHRSIQPFWNAGGNYGDAASWTGNFITYVDPNSLANYQTALDGSQGITDQPLNAVGRHHPKVDSASGGTANFAFVDGHVGRMTVQQTLDDFLWGSKFYGLTGSPTVSKSYNQY